MLLVAGVKDQSSSFGILATGGGIYNDLYEIMKSGAGSGSGSASGEEEAEEDSSWKIKSFDVAFARVLEDPTYAVFAGREKLVFDATRLGKQQFHINRDVFFTKYKAVVLRNGSPLRIPFDKVLMRIFETGILNKVTDVSLPQMER